MKIIIFGISDAAELAHFYFNNDTNHQVEAFTVDANFMPEIREFCGLPIVPFEEVSTLYPPNEYAFFVALGYSKLNQNRKDKYIAAKNFGYKLVSYISSKATVLNDGKIGENCFILEDNTIQPFVTIGNNVTLWSGNHIGHHSCINDHCFITSHVVVSGRVQIGHSCFVGVNATLRDKIKVGEKCIIGAGARILTDISADGAYIIKSTERSRAPSSKFKV